MNDEVEKDEKYYCFVIYYKLAYERKKEWSCNEVVSWYLCTAEKMHRSYCQYVEQRYGCSDSAMLIETAQQPFEASSAYSHLSLIDPSLASCGS